MFAAEVTLLIDWPRSEFKAAWINLVIQHLDDA